MSGLSTDSLLLSSMIVFTSFRCCSCVHGSRKILAGKAGKVLPVLLAASYIYQAPNTDTATICRYVRVAYSYRYNSSPNPKRFEVFTRESIFRSYTSSLAIKIAAAPGHAKKPGSQMYPKPETMGLVPRTTSPPPRY